MLPPLPPPLLRPLQTLLVMLPLPLLLLVRHLR